jgi:hypothetical protein
MRTIEITAYKFDELQNDAKEKAMDWYRDGNLDYDWWDCVYDSFKEKSKEVGFDVTKMYFSGFWSQGDGAMFEYDYIDDKLRMLFIDSLKLTPMRKQWLINNTTISGKGKHRGHYNHEKCCAHSIYWEVDNGDLHWSTNFYKWIESFSDELEEYVIDLYEELCGDLYSSLEKEYEYLQSDEVVKESIIANDYEFDEYGNIL